MSTILAFALAIVLVVMTSHIAKANFDPSTVIDCYVHTGMKHLAEKEGCESRVITVRGCWGRCDSYQVPSLLAQFLDVNHPLCTPASYKNVTVQLDNCEVGVDPTYSYAEATTCGCRKIKGNVMQYDFRPDMYLP